MAEITLTDCKVSECKSENQRLADELANIKRKYLGHKKLQSESKNMNKVEHVERLPQLINKPHFTGGGFRIENPTRRLQI
uniref:Uncharacterized protein n=1 Tax=Knipowitschia caucasica TaxID=637954 RepID=A0AAV2JG70_KNICA